MQAVRRYTGVAVSPGVRDIVAAHSPAMGTSVLARLDARDRALFTRYATGPSPSRLVRVAWSLITHGGGALASIAAAAVPIAIGGALRHPGARALIALVASHLIVQLVKRTVGRPRPSRHGALQWADEPDKFSFPSGHSAASMSVAMIYAFAFGHTALLLIPLAALVGLSRVRLGVHYPGDVLAGQLIAIATAIVVGA